jgi:hypothetical protein
MNHHVFHGKRVCVTESADIIIIFNIMLLICNDVKKSTYVAAVAVTVLFGVSGLIMSSANPFAFATTNQAV